MKLRQTRRKIIGTANLNESFNSHLNKSMRLASIHKINDSQQIDPNQYLQSGYEKEPRKRIRSESVEKRKGKVYDDDNNLVRLAVTKFIDEDKPNLKKLLEIKKCLNIKYDQRKRYLETFKVWDEDGKGYITADNIRSVLENMNIKISQKEAEILLASADFQNNKKLSSVEFYELLFDRKTSLYKPDELQQKAIDQNKEISNILEEENQVFEKKRKADHIQKLSKGSINKMKISFGTADTKNSGLIGYKYLEKVFRKSLGITENIMTEEGLDAIFQKFKTENNQFDYVKFLDSINNDQNIESKKVHLPILKPSDPFVIMDSQRINVQALDRIKKKADQQIKILKKQFQNEGSFKEYLKNELNIKDEQEFENYSIKQSQLQEILQKASNISSSKQLENVLELFVYNAENKTLLKDIIKPIYNENQKEMYLRLNMPRRGPPPAEQKIQKSDISKDFDNKKVQEALQKFEQKFSSENIFSIFKKLDLDNDGYVSRKDILLSLQRNNLDQSLELVDFLDNEGKGYVDFKTFASRVNTVQQIGQDAVPVYLSPAKEHTAKLIEQAKKSKIHKNLNEENKQMRSNSQFVGQISIAAIPNSSLYLSEEKRMNYSRLDPVFEEKQFKQQLNINRLNRIKEQRDNYNAQIQARENLAEEKQRMRIQAKQRLRSDLGESFLTKQDGSFQQIFA